MVRLEKVCKKYRTRSGEIKALDDVSLHVKEGELVVIRGPSGSGKTTLLLSIGGMLRPTKGHVIVDNNDIYSLNNRERARFRAENIGFVFQMFHLVPYLSIFENVLLSSGIGTKQKRQKEVEILLKRLNLSDRLYHKPSELSAGEKQRTAIARALITQPKIILADEPTGNLDPENSEQIIGYLEEFHQAGGTVIVVTHGKLVDQYTDRIIYLRNGQI
ncbi:MAG: ABC transporter ATP-binding protein [Candidatus Aminicenantes bacterium]|nr:ABC transporter ATP-binding protein [Candidatus Aminicenantes bacterium]